MGANPGTAAFYMQPDEATQVRRMKDAERDIQTMRADGTLRALIDSLPASVTANVLTALAAGIATTTVDASSTVTAAGAVTGAEVVSTGDANIAGFAFTPGAYGYDITYTRQQVWMGNDGRIAWASSSREKKTDIEDAFTQGWVDPLAILDISSKMFHYRAELAKRDDPESLEYVGPDYHVAWEYGAIAEELHELGLWQAVVYKDHWKPIGIHYDLLGLLAIEAAKHVWRKHLELREDHLALTRRVEALEVLLGVNF